MREISTRKSLGKGSSTEYPGSSIVVRKLSYPLNILTFLPHLKEWLRDCCWGVTPNPTMVMDIGVSLWTMLYHSPIYPPPRPWFLQCWHVMVPKFSCCDRRLILMERYFNLCLHDYEFLSAYFVSVFRLLLLDILMVR